MWREIFLPEHSVLTHLTLPYNIPHLHMTVHAQWPSQQHKADQRRGCTESHTIMSILLRKSFNFSDCTATASFPSASKPLWEPPSSIFVILTNALPQGGGKKTNWSKHTRSAGIWFKIHQQQEEGGRSSFLTSIHSACSYANTCMKCWPTLREHSNKDMFIINVR